MDHPVRTHGGCRAASLDAQAGCDPDRSRWFVLGAEPVDRGNRIGRSPGRSQRPRGRIETGHGAVADGQGGSRRGWNRSVLEQLSAADVDGRQATGNPVAGNNRGAGLEHVELVVLGLVDGGEGRVQRAGRAVEPPE